MKNPEAETDRTCQCETPRPVHYENEDDWRCGTCGRRLEAGCGPDRGRLRALLDLKSRAATLQSLEEFEGEFGPPSSRMDPTTFSRLQKDFPEFSQVREQANWHLEMGIELIVQVSRDGLVTYLLGLD